MRPAENIAFFADFRLRRRDVAQSRAFITVAIRRTLRVESSMAVDRQALGTLMNSMPHLFYANTRQRACIRVFSG